MDTHNSDPPDANTGVHEVTADSDRLTSLPLQIRYTILSLLPLASAVQTSVLSKGWKYSWKNIRRLSFEENATLSHNIGRLSYLYEKLKVALQGQTLDEFVLRLHSPTIVPVSAWIDEAIGKNIRTLDINVDIIDLPESFFVSGTLSNLKIRCVGFVRDNINEVHVDLPKLVSFDTSCHQEVASVVLHIMRGCPSLHTLTLSNCSFLPLVQPMTMARNVTSLVLTDTIAHGLSTVMHVLHNTPTLKFLSVGKMLGHIDRRLVPPTCLQSLKKLELTDIGSLDVGPDYVFLKFVVKETMQLHKVTVRCKIYLAPNRLERIRHLLREAGMIGGGCRIEFDGPKGYEII
ncbi:hypothetical protein R6Q59_002756 [Mikania micrantha]